MIHYQLSHLEILLFHETKKQTNLKATLDTFLNRKYLSCTDKVDRLPIHIHKHVFAKEVIDIYVYIEIFTADNVIDGPHCMLLQFLAIVGHNFVF